jgi:NADH-quinone oxidoreductase subunit B
MTMTDDPSPTGIRGSSFLSAGTWQEADASDLYFNHIRDELAEKGFFTAGAEELITWAGPVR